MDPRLTLESVEALIAEQRRSADAHRRAAGSRPGSRAAGSVTIRMASADDGPVLDRLAGLDSGTPPTGPTLVAEEHGEVVAALPLRGGRPVAHPFRHTREMVRLLELRARQLQGGRPAGLRRLLPRVANR